MSSSADEPDAKRPCVGAAAVIIVSHDDCDTQTYLMDLVAAVIVLSNVVEHSIDHLVNFAGLDSPSPSELFARMTELLAVPGSTATKLHTLLNTLFSKMYPLLLQACSKTMYINGPLIQIYADAIDIFDDKVTLANFLAGAAKVGDGLVCRAMDTGNRHAPCCIKLNPHDEAIVISIADV